MIKTKYVCNVCGENKKRYQVYGWSEGKNNSCFSLWGYTTNEFSNSMIHVCHNCDDKLKQYYRSINESKTITTTSP